MEVQANFLELVVNIHQTITVTETALHYMKTFFDTFPTRKQSMLIFTDSMSALQGLEKDSQTDQITKGNG